MPMKKSMQCFSLMAVAAAAALSCVSAASAQPAAVSQEQNNRLWFVELTGKTVSDGASSAAVQAEQAKFRNAAAAARIGYSERRSFSTLFNGFSVDIGPAERARLAKLPGVRAVYPVEVIAAPEPIVSDGPGPDMVAALSLTRANIAQNTLGLTGAGIRVAIIDSGVDIDHPDFGGNGAPGTTSFPTSRITHGWDFVGDAFNGGNTPVPDANPDDCGSGGGAAGHGTHVAGIVGANGGIKGVAPGVSLGAYRVFGCNGSTTADILIAAMERAMADGMHVINMSIGARAQWPQYPTAQASSRLAQKGIVVVASIGNNGPGGSQPDALFAAGAPGVGEHVIGAASFDNAQRSFTSADVPYGFIRATGAPVPPTTGSLPIARIGPPSVPPAINGTDACSALTPGSLTGQAVLIQRGTCGFYVKAFNAQAAGAAAVVIYDNRAGIVSATVSGTPAITIPVVTITQREGTILNAAIANGPTTISWTPNYVSYPFGTGGLISGFSSFGLGSDLSFKPDLGAPGGGILSTYPLEAGGTATLSGTSMSSPHIAGVAALVLQAIPTAALGRTGPVVGRNAPPAINMVTRLMNTASRRNWSGNPDLGLVEHAFRQGAGMVDVVAAVQTEQFVTPAKFSTGESQAGPRLQRLTIRNDSTLPVTYTMGHVAGAAAAPNVRANNNATNPVSLMWGLGGVLSAPATVGFSAPSVIVPARGMATVDVTVTANPGLAARSLHGGYITLTPQGPGTPLQVPYGGLVGDYQTTVHIGVGPQTAAPMPWLATTPNGTSFSRCATPCPAFTLTGVATSPHVTVSLAHHARTLKLEAFDLATGNPRGLISEDDYVGRAGTPSGFFTYAWNGSTSLGPQPNGTYTLRLSALKANGNPANPADWEVWNSPTVTIARP